MDKSFVFSSLPLAKIFVEKQPKDSKMTFKYSCDNKDQLVKFLDDLADQDIDYFTLEEEDGL